MAEVIDDKFMFGLIIKSMFQAIRFARGGNRTKWDPHVVEDQDDIRPLMADDIPFAMIEFLRVFRMQTCTMLECTIDNKRNFPGQTLQGVQRFGKLFGLLLGEALSRRDRNLGMRLQHLTELCFVKARKTCGVFEGMLLRHDHQKEEITGANPLKTLTDCHTTSDPSLQGASLHGASPP